MSMNGRTDGQVDYVLMALVAVAVLSLAAGAVIADYALLSVGLALGFGLGLGWLLAGLISGGRV